MAQWKVFKGVVEILPHNNADSLIIMKIEDYQIVSSLANGYKNGDTLIIMPAGTVIKNEGLRREEEKYLTGPRKNRVKSISLRGEVSQGATFPIGLLGEFYDDRTVDLINAAEIGADISELMDMEKYEPPIPSNLAGQVRGIFLGGPKGEINHNIYMHDAYQWGAFGKDFDPEEQVLITEKLHGSLCSYTVVVNEGEIVSEVLSSKGQLKKGIELIETPDNLYWRAVRHMGLKEKIAQYITEMSIVEGIITVTGEALPVQAGFSYGVTTDKPTIAIFDIEVNGIHMSYLEMPSYLAFEWVPVLYNGLLKNVDVYEICKGKETYSGSELHIREGVCVTPAIPRKNAKGNFNLVLKVINPAYSKKETGEELS